MAEARKTPSKASTKDINIEQFKHITSEHKDLQFFDWAECEVDWNLPLGEGAVLKVYSGTYKDRDGNRKVAAFKVPNHVTLNSLRRKHFPSMAKEISFLLMCRGRGTIVDLIGIAFYEIKVYEVPALLVEKADGVLGDYLMLRKEEENPVGGDSKVALAKSIGDGVKAIHMSGIIHGDLKGDNILLFNTNDPRGDDFIIPKISDFGFSATTASLKQEEDELGSTPRFEPPECTELSQESAFQMFKRSLQRDYYSYGLSVWQIAADGEDPFDGMEGDEIMQAKILDGGISVLISSLPPNVHPDLKRLILQCCQLNPALRTMDINSESTAHFVADSGTVFRNRKDEEKVVEFSGEALSQAASISEGRLHRFGAAITEQLRNFTGSSRKHETKSRKQGRMAAGPSAAGAPIMPNTAMSYSMPSTPAVESTIAYEAYEEIALHNDGKTVTEEKVDVEDIAAGPNKYLSPDGSTYIVSNETVSEKDLVEETVVINGKPVRRWTWLGRIVDVTKDGAKFIVHGVGDMVVSAADGTRMVAQDAGALAKGTGNLAKNVVIGTAVVAGAAGLGAFEFVRGHSGLYQRKPSPDGKTIIEEKVEISKVPKDTLYLGPDGEKYVSKNEEVPAKDIVEETVVIGGQPVKKLTWLGKVVDATKNGANYVVHGVGDVMTTTEGGVKTVAKDTGKVAGALGLGAYEPRGWLRKKQGPKGEVIVEEVKAEEITESVYTAPDGSTYLIAKDKVVDEKDVVEKDVIGPDGKKTIHEVGDIVHDAAGVGWIRAAIGTGARSLGTYGLATEEKVDVKDIAAGPSKYLSPDGSTYIVSNETATVSEKKRKPSPDGKEPILIESGISDSDAEEGMTTKDREELVNEDERVNEPTSPLPPPLPPSRSPIPSPSHSSLSSAAPVSRRAHYSPGPAPSPVPPSPTPGSAFPTLPSRSALPLAPPPPPSFTQDIPSEHELLRDGNWVKPMGSLSSFVLETVSDGEDIINVVLLKHVKDRGYFNREKNMLGKLCNTVNMNIIKLLKTDEEDVSLRYTGTLYLQNCSFDLNEYYHQEDVPELDTTKYIFRQIVNGIMGCHHMGIVHGDLRTNNIQLYSCNGLTRVWKLTNFEFAYNFDEDMPKVSYELCAPEFKQGNFLKASTSLDMYGLGTVVISLFSSSRKATNLADSDMFDTSMDMVTDESFRETLIGLLKKNPTERTTLQQLMSFSWFSQTDLPIAKPSLDNLQYKPIITSNTNNSEKRSKTSIERDLRFTRDMIRNIPGEKAPRIFVLKHNTQDSSLANLSLTLYFVCEDTFHITNHPGYKISNSTSFLHSFGKYLSFGVDSVSNAAQPVVPQTILNRFGETEEEFLQSLREYANKVDSMNFEGDVPQPFLPYSILHGKALNDFAEYLQSLDSKGNVYGGLRRKYRRDLHSEIIWCCDNHEDTVDIEDQIITEQSTDEIVSTSEQSQLIAVSLMLECRELSAKIHERAKNAKKNNSYCIKVADLVVNAQGVFQEDLYEYLRGMQMDTVLIERLNSYFAVLQEVDEFIKFASGEKLLDQKMEGNRQLELKRLRNLLEKVLTYTGIDD